MGSPFRSRLVALLAYHRKSIYIISSGSVPCIYTKRIVLGEPVTIG